MNERTERNKINKRKLEEEKKRKLELEKQKVLRKILTPKARSRLTNIKLAKPKYAERIENQLFQLAQFGRIEKLTDEKFKKMLKKLAENKKEYKFKGLF